MESGKEFFGKPLEPGIYMGSRKIPGTPSFRHQFIVMVPKDPTRFKGKLKNLGNGVQGIVVGGYVHNVLNSIFGGGRLAYNRNFRRDVKPLKNYLRGSEEGDALVFRAKNRGLDIDNAIDETLQRAEVFRNRTKKAPISYPGFIKNMLGFGKNSNTFVQSLAEAVGINNRRRDHPGLDPGSGLRYPKELFELKEGALYKEAYLDGYQKGAGLIDTGLGALGDALAYGYRKVTGPTQRQFKADTNRYLTDTKKTIDDMVADSAAKANESLDVEGQINRGITGAGAQTWEAVKPYAVGAGALAVGLPLLMMGMSIADRIALHKKLQQLQELQRKETELEQRQMDLAEEEKRTRLVKEEGL